MSWKSKIWKEFEKRKDARWERSSNRTMKNLEKYSWEVYQSETMADLSATFKVFAAERGWDEKKQIDILLDYAGTIEIGGESDYASQFAWDMDKLT